MRSLWGSKKRTPHTRPLSPAFGSFTVEVATMFSQKEGL